MSNKRRKFVKKPRDESIQTAVRIPREMHERLKKSELGVSEEIRRRVEQSFEADAYDRQTREFATVVQDAAREVEIELGRAWHQDGGAHRTYRRAILRVLSKWRPPDYVDNILEKVELPRFQEREHASQPVNDADELGIFLADGVLKTPDRTARANFRAAQEKTLKEIVKLQQRRESGDD
jgi:hypothetical protein